jgi:hypothetical protein
MIDSTEAEQLALNFLMGEWDISEDDRGWFKIWRSRLVTDIWYIVEIGIEGLPDKWVIQVYDTKECDPNYTFSSPIKASEGTADLTKLPERVAEMLASERGGG